MEHYNPRSVEEVFKEFKGRRTALLTALTKDFDEVYRQCNTPAQNWKLCLIGHPGERWEVNLAEEEMDAMLPQPLRGINFGQERMEKREWLTMVAIHSDIWLLRVAFNFSSRSGHNKADRNRLFDMINKLPTILEVVSGKEKEIVCGECNEGYIVGDLWKQCFECESSFHLMKCLKFNKDKRRHQQFVCSSCALEPLAKSAAGESTKMGKF
ncbi:PREDICTED: PHD finger protein ALFIN-LIKE 3-like [Ipomoea nil]|uniref:PHD finger protein ALFIN-LIKE 3-like n=1 Tax=Ipomoea nil TaxID=35883 RepID=UPI000901EA53|nr:PREDICTED: PHD finger protein ALFIN-LIKE 3-like [Ipomoea nil]